MLDTDLYYTFSTISQTIAGAMAFLSAFVLYRIEAFRNPIETYMVRILNRLNFLDGHHDHLDKLMFQCHYSEFVRYCKAIDLKKYLSGYNDAAERKSFNRNYTMLYETVRHRTWCLRSLVSGLVLTTILIIYSVWVLSNVRVLKVSVHAPCFLLAGFAFLVVCLISYLIVILISFVPLRESKIIELAHKPDDVPRGEVK